MKVQQAKKNSCKTRRERLMSKYLQLEEDNLLVRRLWKEECERVNSGLVISTRKRDDFAQTLAEIHRKYIEMANVLGRDPELTSL